MGLQASIEITYSQEIELESFIEILLSFGWSVNDNDKITCLTNDDFNWKSYNLNQFELLKQLMFERFADNKITGIALTLPDLTGCLFHFLPEKKEVMILLSINRVRFDDFPFTDYSFYFKNLNPILGNCSKLNYCDVI